MGADVVGDIYRITDTPHGKLSPLQRYGQSFLVRYVGRRAEMAPAGLRGGCRCRCGHCRAHIRKVMLPMTASLLSNTTFLERIRRPAARRTSTCSLRPNQTSCRLRRNSPKTKREVTVMPSTSADLTRIWEMTRVRRDLGLCAWA